jgi:hypothetical protein
VRGHGADPTLSSMSAIAPLATSYADARAGFLAAAASAGGRLGAHMHPHAGPDGGELAVDVADLGPPDAADVVLVMSGTHGVEGYCGSALQTHWLGNCADRRPPNTRVMFVHAFNPVGFAWVRRVNEDNVDLNRNFIDWSQTPPGNPGYDELADVLVPREWTDDTREQTLATVGSFVERHGMPALVAAVSSGQYRHPTGLFYGGSGPVWSHRWLRGWTAATLASCRRLVVIDLHSGLGPWGHGEHIIHGHAGEPMFTRARERWGDVVRSMYDGESVSAILTGDWLGRIEDFVPHAEVTATALEFGTVDQFTVLEALRADAWLHAHGDPTGVDADHVRNQVRAAFADDDPAWLGTLWDQFDVAMSSALA